MRNIILSFLLIFQINLFGQNNGSIEDFLLWWGTAANQIKTTLETGEFQTVDGQSWVSAMETVTSLSYDEPTKVLTYTDEDGTIHNIDLSGLIDNTDDWTNSGDDIYNSNSANVGIGTSTPSSRLHVYKADNPTLTIGELFGNCLIKNASFSGTGLFRFDQSVSNGTDHCYFDFGQGSITSGAVGVRVFDGAGFIQHNLLDSDSYVNNISGNFGIGTSTPGAKLHVNGGILLSNVATATTDGTIRYNGTDFQGRIGGIWKSLTASVGDGNGIYSAANSSLTVPNDYDILIGNNMAFDNDLLYFDSNFQRIGISNSNPNTDFDVNGTIRMRDGATDGTWIKGNSLGHFSWSSITKADITDGVDDADSDPTNEIQDLSLSANILSLSGSVPTVDFSPYLDNTDDWTNSGDDIYNSNSGNVGIGTSTPSSKLHIYKADNPTLTIGELFGNCLIKNASFSGTGLFRFDQSVSNGTDHCYFDFGQGSITSGAVGVRVFDGAGLVQHNLLDSDSYVNNISGNFGIGTSTPGAKLHVNGGILLSNVATATTNGTIRYNGTDFQGRIGGAWKSLTSVDDADSDPTNEIQDLSLSANILSLSGSVPTVDFSPYLDNTDDWTNSSNDIYNSNSGNVGIGTSSPDEKFHVNGTIKSSSSAFADKFFVGYGSLSNVLFKVIEDSDGDGQLNMYDKTGTEKIRLNALGNSFFTGANVGIGNSSPTKKLEVDYTTAVTGVQFKRTDFGTTGSSMYFNGSGGHPQIRFDRDGDQFTIGNQLAKFVISRNSNLGTNNIFSLSSTGALTLNEAITFPTADGSDGQVLTTNGSGTLSFESVATSSIYTGSGSTPVTEVVVDLGNDLTFSGSERDTKIAANGDLVINEGTAEFVATINSFGNTVIGNTSYSDLQFKASDITRMTIRHTGDVGIGTSSPDGKLDVNGYCYFGSGSSVTTIKDVLKVQGQTHGSVPTGEVGMIVYVTTTGSEFDTTGFWMYEDRGSGAAWYKM